MMTLLYAIILGIVEGITEFLPVSSTGHMVLVSNILGIANDPFTKSFEIIIQLGAILAVVVIYWRKIWQTKHLVYKLAVAFVPTAVIGLIVYKLVKTLLGSAYVVVVSLALGGIVLVFFDRLVRARNTRAEQAHKPAVVLRSEDITTKQAFLVGIFQAIAVIPGVSRSGATIVGGELIGIGRVAIVEFSFMLAIPTMIAATGLDIVKSHDSFSTNELGLLAVGLVVAFLVALFAVKSFLTYIQSHSFKAFGVYRIVIAILFLLFFIR